VLAVNFICIGVYRRSTSILKTWLPVRTEPKERRKTVLESIPWKKIVIVLAVIIVAMVALKVLGLCPICKSG
jgi:hypothetical protein